MSEWQNLTIRLTIDIALVLWFLTWMLPRPNRRLWTLGWVLFVGHVWAVFQFAHHWSHAAAFQHVENESGFGAGIYVNYAFGVYGIYDVIRWNVNGLSAKPSRWWLGIMAFIAFNATVIYEDGVVRWVGLGMFVLIGICLFRRQSAG